MNTESAMPFDPNSDIYEFGLIAAAVPGFSSALLRALLAAGANGAAEPGSGDTGEPREAA